MTKWKMKKEKEGSNKLPLFIMFIYIINIYYIDIGCIQCDLMLGQIVFY